jgi:hypothetical protein
VPLQIRVERFLGAKVARAFGEFLDDKTSQVRFAAFDVVGIDAVIPHFGVSHRDNLAAVTGVGQDLLITRH